MIIVKEGMFSFAEFAKPNLAVETEIFGRDVVVFEAFRVSISIGFEKLDILTDGESSSIVAFTF